MTGITTGTIKWVLRLEGLSVLFAAIYFYKVSDYSWGTFAIYFLVPDLSLLAYFAGKQTGAISYNIAHSYVGAVICSAIGFWLSHIALIHAGLIWIAHIGFDRALGYGLKYSEGFGYTHLGLIGKASSTVSTMVINQEPRGNRSDS